MEHGISGWVQRYVGHDLRLFCQGSQVEIENFEAFLNTLDSTTPKLCDYVQYENVLPQGLSGFEIITSHARQKDGNRVSGGVVNGCHSDHLDEFDKESEYSANSGVLLGSQCVR